MSDSSTTNQQEQDTKTLRQLAYFVAGFMVFTAAMAITVNVVFS